MSKTASDTRKNVVVVGGGGAGAPIINALSSKLDPMKHNLILITARPFFIHLVAAIRMVVTDEGRIEETALIPYDTNFVNGNGTLKVGTVVGIEKDSKGDVGGEVILESGERIPYTVLALAPGSTWDGPLALPNTKADTIAWLKKWRSMFEKANDIVFAGGGAVGIEYSGEIKDIWPDKNVTIVHSDQMLLNKAYPDRFRKDVEARIHTRGVNVVLGDHIDELPAEGAGEVRTRKGVTIKTDLALLTRGPRPNTSFISSSLGVDVLAKNGYVKILPTLQLPSNARIFAAGDIIDFPEQKQVGKYYTHANIVTANILSVLADQPATIEYRGPSFEGIVITIGKTHGAAYFSFLWGLTFGDMVSTMIKSKGLLIEMTRKRMGLPG